MMKIEVGKKYRTRRGKIAIVVAKGTGRDYPYRVNLGGYGYSYTEGGRFISDARDSPHDLVEEISEPEVLKPAETKQGAIVKLEVGKKYRARDGEVAEVVAMKSSNARYPYLVLCHSGGYYMYTEAGELIQGATCANDLVEEIPEPEAPKPAETKQGATVKLEVGKKYRTRDGEKVGTVSGRSVETYYPYRVTMQDGSHNSYTETGAMFRDCESDLDLVEEISDPTPVKLETGFNIYAPCTTRKGEKAVVVTHDTYTRTLPDLAITSPTMLVGVWENNSGPPTLRLYYSDGTHSHGYTTDDDLINVPETKEVRTTVEGVDIIVTTGPNPSVRLA